MGGLVLCKSQKLCRRKQNRCSVIPIAKTVIDILDPLEEIIRIAPGRVSAGKTPTRSGNRVKIRSGKGCVQLTVRANTSLQMLFVYGKHPRLREFLAGKLTAQGFDVIVG